MTRTAPPMSAPRTQGWQPSASTFSPLSAMSGAVSVAWVRVTPMAVDATVRRVVEGAVERAVVTLFPVRGRPQEVTIGADLDVGDVACVRG